MYISNHITLIKFIERAVTSNYYRHFQGEEIMDVITTTAITAANANDQCQQCKWWQENGDGSQMICDICSPSSDYDDDGDNKTINNNNNNNTFPNDENAVEFPDDSEPGEANDGFNNAVSWREVPLQTWLRVDYIHEVTTQYGPANIVELRKRDGEEIKAWTTSIIGAALTKNDKNKEGKNLFIKSVGKTLSKKRKTHYYNFQLKLF